MGYTGLLYGYEGFVSAIAFLCLARWAEMAPRFAVRAAIIIVITTAIIIAIVFSVVFGGNGCSRCRTDGTAENSALSATNLIADGGPNCASNTTTQRSVGGVIRNGTQRGGTQRYKNEQRFHVHDVNPMIPVI